jgi:hypothetical protein
MATSFGSWCSIDMLAGRHVFTVLSVPIQIIDRFVEEAK